MLLPFSAAPTVAERAALMVPVLAVVLTLAREARRALHRPLIEHCE